MLETIDKRPTTSAPHAPPLFVHGACSSARIWDDHFLDFFAAKGYRAIALSLRGHGASSSSKPLKDCSLADYVEDVRAVAAELPSPPVMIGHSMGCWVVLNYLAKHGASAGILMAPGTPKGLRRWALHALRRHPWLVLRCNTFGNPVDLFDTPASAREFLFSANTPESTVTSCASRLEPESARAARETVNQLPDARDISAPLLVLGAGSDGSRVDGDAAAVAEMYQADMEIFPDMGHVMMLEPGWSDVAERIRTWLDGEQQQ
ncbi:alpha/beta hydrolase [Mycolicibacterium sphagni]|uniref:Alpha/beta hydrolase n=1 Tax=Mycolicibacterium sphagni TaxID=1786 RepID=A0ABX2K1R3_9MYCO|nr:alpha/beta hydrolase [Mycolicibacterium sphagni]NTY61021.1 alpha/beta hydrolase [Mycolicibacterium sphagni]